MKRRSIIQGFPIFVALILVMLTSGCAAVRMYSGEKLPKEQVAVIKGSQNISFLTLLLAFSNVKILAVDLEGNDALLRYNVNKVEVMPGFHRVDVKVHKDVGGSGLDGWGAFYKDDKFTYLRFNAEAGHEYKIKVPSWWKKDSLLTVIDTQSGNVIVSSFAPSPKQPSRPIEAPSNGFWFKPGTDIEQLKQDYSECGEIGYLLKGQKQCMREKGYTWATY